MKKRKVKKAPIITIVIILVLTVGGFSLYKYIEYRNSNVFKLLELGYTKEEVPIIEKKIKKMDAILSMKHEDKLTEIIEQTYFMEKNLSRYLSYQKKNTKKDMSDIVASVNTDTDRPFYTNTKDTDMSKKDLILVNKYYKISKDIEAPTVVTISNKYAYANNQIKEDIYPYFKEMCESALTENIKLIANSGYRSYESQEKIYKAYEDSKGSEYADQYAAKQGFSEHQTGLTIDIIAVGTNRNTFEASPAFAWLQEHAAEFGFILRFPKGKEHLTGYEYESWHYRYVGKDVAQKIKKLDITFDEYYAFYIE